MFTECSTVPGVFVQATGDVRDITIPGREASGDDLKEDTNVPVLLEGLHDVHLDLVVFTEGQGLLLHRLLSVVPTCRYYV